MVVGWGWRHNVPMLSMRRARPAVKYSVVSQRKRFGLYLGVADVVGVRC